MTRSEYLRDMIYDGLSDLTNYDSSIRLDYSFQIDKMPFVFIRVENETMYNDGGELFGDGIIRGECQIFLQVGLRGQMAIDLDIELLKESDLWIERIEECLRNISLPKNYVHEGELDSANKYEIDVSEIRVTGNNRNGIPNNNRVLLVTINGKIIYDKTFL